MRSSMTAGRGTRLAVAAALAIVAPAVVAPLAAQVPAERQAPRAATPVPFDVARGNVYRGAFTHDGRQFYFFTRLSASTEDYRIFVSTRTGARWSAPARVDLGGDYSDLYPTISPDGKRMVFSSYRRAPGDTAAVPNATLWYADRTVTGWAPPVPMTKASRVGQYNAGPQFEADGSVSFSGGEPLVTRWNGREYGTPLIDARVTRWREWRKDLFIWGGTPSPTGDAMLLTVSRLDPVSGKRLPGDLWVSRKTGDSWSVPRPLGGGVNSERNDNFPFFSPDGRELYFVRDFARFLHLPLATALGDTSDGHTAHTVSIPFELEDARVFVPVRAADDSVRWFIFDTGAQPTIVDANVAATLRLAVADAGSTTGAGRGSLRQGRAHSVALRVGTVPL